MPMYRKMTKEELDALTMPPSGERARVREEYLGYLADLDLGEGGELQLEPPEKKVTVKNRLKRAAKDLNLSIEFRRSGDNVVRYTIKPASDTPPARRGGRRKKSDS